MIEAKVIADSINSTNQRITTLQLQYPRFIHSEVMTHRVFSRNAMSSRAIPVAKMIAQVRDNPAKPIHWGTNQPGMQASAELVGEDLAEARDLWFAAADAAAEIAEKMTKVGLHKQVANRILEPFQWMRTIVTATDWDNFFELRDHPDAQPEFHELAVCMRVAMKGSDPVYRPSGITEKNWHLPYVTEEERSSGSVPLARISAARCARVSYLKHDGQRPSFDEDRELFDKLAGARPFHASPLEHQARAFGSPERSRNFQGWKQFREIFESQQ